MNYKVTSIALLFVCVLFACQQKQVETKPSLKDLSDVSAVLPEGDGYALFQSRCITCHSLRYIQMQPDMKRQGWEKIVDKMRKNFGATLSDSEAVAIVDYLDRIKGSH